jgi:hypothetical protein
MEEVNKKKIIQRLENPNYDLFGYSSPSIGVEKTERIIGPCGLPKASDKHDKLQETEPPLHLRQKKGSKKKVRIKYKKENHIKW